MASRCPRCRSEEGRVQLHGVLAELLMPMDGGYVEAVVPCGVVPSSTPELSIANCFSRSASPDLAMSRSPLSILAPLVALEILVVLVSYILLVGLVKIGALLSDMFRRRYYEPYIRKVVGCKKSLKDFLNLIRHWENN